MRVKDDPISPPAPHHAAAPPADTEPRADLCVLASGSSGNCTVLAYRRAGSLLPRLCLIDAGLSPRRTVKRLAEHGLALHQLDDVVLTHLDTDHFRPTWSRLLPAHSAIWVHRAHRRRAAQVGLTDRPVETFEDHFKTRGGVSVRVTMASHDDLGVATLRFTLDGHGGGTLGFATDLGRVTDEIVRALRGVGVLAIESNYCPQMQLAFARPWFLKHRIMGGRGHLSNGECVEAIARIRPRHHVVLLHLSRECNHPDTVHPLHRGARYAVTVTSQTEPTPWIHVQPGHDLPDERTAVEFPPHLFAATGR